MEAHEEAVVEAYEEAIMEAYEEEKVPFEEWVSKIKRDYPSCHDPEAYEWRLVGEEWLVSTRENGSYYQKAFHICRRSWKSSDTVVRLDEACPCGDVLPEGLRMVALLLEAL